MAVIAKLTQDDPVQPVSIVPGVTYHSTDEAITISNNGISPWRDLTVTIHVNQSVYTYADKTVLPASGKTTIPLAKFSASSGSPKLDPFRQPPQTLVISAVLPDGERASKVGTWPTPQASPVTRPSANGADSTP